MPLSMCRYEPLLMLTAVSSLDDVLPHCQQICKSERVNTALLLSQYDPSYNRQAHLSKWPSQALAHKGSCVYSDIRLAVALWLMCRRQLLLMTV